MYQIVLIIGIASNTVINNKLDIDVVMNYSKLSPIVILVFVLVFLYWFWAVGIGLNNKLSKKLKLHTSKFKLFLILIATYFITILAGISLFINKWGNNIDINAYASNRTISIMLALFFLLSMFIMFCLFFSFYFVAKILRTTELQEKVNFGDYAGEFLLIGLLFPIGIWFIQPRINRLVNA